MTNATHDGVLADMRQLGLTDYEARILFALVQSPPSTAYELAKKSGVPRPNAYTALQTLTERGAVMPVSEKPARFVANDPDAFFGRIANQTQSLCDDLVSQLSRLAAPQADSYVWMLEGEANVDHKVGDLIEGASENIWIKGDTALMENHKDALRRATVDRGVSLMVILFGTNAEAYRFTDKCSILIHEASGVRMGSADNLFTVVVDHSEMLTANEEDEVRAAYTHNQAVVKMALSLIRHDYYMAEIFARFKDDLDTAFGPHLMELRGSSYTPDQIESFREKTGLSDHPPIAAKRSSR